MIKIVQIGVGPIGQQVVRYINQRPGLEIVAAVDPDPEKCSKDLGDLCLGKSMGVFISKDLEQAMAGKKADIALLTTSSDIYSIKDEIAAIAGFGLNIVTTCEELSYPWPKQKELAKSIDTICKQHNIACIGTGVNPGFLMDYLPIVLSSVCQRVDKVTVSRIQDASIRRIPFQKKIGAGLNPDEFKAHEEKGTLRHVGLLESVNMIAQSLGWKLDQTEESLKPVIAMEKITSGYRIIEPGQACGVEQIGSGYKENKEVIRLHFRAAVGEKEPNDLIEIRGKPSFKSTIQGGIDGDIATCAVIINTIPSILKCTPGLKTMLDIPVPGFTVF